MSRGNAKVALLIFGSLIAVLIMLSLVLFGSYQSVWNSLNTYNQRAEGGKSLYSAALNTCTQKIQGVWIIADQYLDHESDTFKSVTKARSGYEDASHAFKTALEQGKSTKELTTTGAEVVKAALAFRIQIEAYPQLRGVEASKEVMRGLQEGVNEIKTALDDWIVAIRDYNTYRNSFLPNLLAGFMGARYPVRIEYYEGKIKELDISGLNPQTR
jgi:hypothetical protein